jgi:CMP/dCMP kinase
LKRIICISGDAASGKTTAAKRALVHLPGWRIVSTGARFRDYCALHNIDPQHISHLDDTFHRAADDFMRTALEQEQHLIAEARLVGYLARELPDALKVYCHCPLDVRAARFVQREPGFAVEEARARISERDEADTEKFLRLYGVDYHDESLYDLVLDTEKLAPDEVADAILKAAGAR